MVWSAFAMLPATGIFCTPAFDTDMGAMNHAMTMASTKDVWFATTTGRSLDVFELPGSRSIVIHRKPRHHNVRRDMRRIG